MTLWGFLIGILLAFIIGGLRLRRLLKESGSENKVDITPAVKVWLWFAVPLTVLGIVTDIVVSLYTDAAWFAEVGYLNVWGTRLALSWALFLGGGLISGSFLAVNYLLIGSFVPGFPEVTDEGKPGTIRRYYEDDKEPVDWARWLASAKRTSRLAILFLALLFGGSAVSQWDDLLKFFNAVPFGKTDPIFGLDVSYYVFNLPVYDWFSAWVSVLAVLTIIGLGGLYAFHYLRVLKQYEKAAAEKVLQTAYAHNSVLLVLLALILAWRNFLERHWLVINGHSSRLTGAGWVDDNVLITAFGIISVVAVISAVVLLINAFRRSKRVLAGILVTYGVFWFVLIVLLPSFAQVFAVNPQELAREEPYIANHLKATREAYNLTLVRERPFPLQPSMTGAEFKDNALTLEQVRIMDWKVALEACNSLQELRQYFDCFDTDVISVDGQQVMLSIREMNIDQLPDAAKNWLNQHLVYTHGYGYPAAAVSEVDVQGYPKYLVKGIPLEGQANLITKNPAIYFGEKTNTWVAVNTRQEELDRPEGSGAVYTHYSGKGGLAVGNSLNRLAWALRLSDLQFLMSEDVTSESRLLIRRNINDRLDAVAPFILWDADPYAVPIPGDRIYWIRDGYLTTRNYPYSALAEDYNYIRSAVKAVIDAYDGTITLYAVDPNEPLTRVWEAIYPGQLFQPLEKMPPMLIPYIRYPQDLFDVQTSKLALYHMRVEGVSEEEERKSIRTFFNREDLWVIPRELIGEKAAEMEPRFGQMGLPDERDEEFVLTIPFSPAGKQNLVAWAAARSKLGSYGEFRLYLLPRDQTVLGPAQMEQQINKFIRDNNLATLLGTKDNPAHWGNLIVPPLRGKKGGSIIAFKPLFAIPAQASASGQRVPTLIRIFTVLSDGTVIQGRSLKEILEVLYSGATLTVPSTQSPGNPSPSTVTGTLIEQADKHFNAAQACSGRGDWICFGTEMEALRRVISELNKTQGK